MNEPRARVVLDLTAVWRGVAAGFVLIVPVAVLVSVTDLSSAWRVLAFFAILFAYATAGYGAARYRPDAPLAHGLVAGLGSYLAWLAIRLVIGGLRGEFGFGLPAALGAQAANPGTLVVDIDGDGSFLMNVQEMATAYCEKLPVKVLLLNNQHLGMVVQWEDRFMQGNRAHTYLGPIHHPEARGQGDGLGPSERYPNFVAIAKGYGCGAAYIRKKSDLVPALEEMINYPGPYVLDVEVPYQEHVLPMIPGGMTARDMIKE